MAGEELILLNFWPSMFGARVKIALAEKGLRYEEKEEDLPYKSRLLRKMNPIYKKVPVLIHNGKPVCESLIIVEYIDEVWSDRVPLLPSHPYERAQARFWADYIDKKIYRAANIISWHSKYEVEEGKKELMEALKQLEGVLGDKAYFGGEVFGFVDIALMGFYMCFHTYETCANFSIEVECPKLMEWGKRCFKRETVSKSLAGPNKICDLVMSSRKKFGLD
ncbi:putative glutathione S-transferase parC [Sesamum alatum]|uniref:glutathione transferase n=1 Tax=Sesamum alatum TaxID=300844 RepID=A0AAE1XYK9_9LAMI|nr:putative glutathione S-transferase parC [Sesamum alatum]